jgi:hypothetical protein
MLNGCRKTEARDTLENLTAAERKALHRNGECEGKSMDEQILRILWEQQRNEGGPIQDLMEWKEKVAKAHQALVERARNIPFCEMPIVYGQLGTNIGLYVLSEWFQLKIGWIVGACSIYEHQQGHPLISALVIS